MLMIIMHNKRDYLESLPDIMKRENINIATIIEKKASVSPYWGRKKAIFPIIEGKK